MIQKRVEVLSAERICIQKQLQMGLSIIISS